MRSRWVTTWAGQAGGQPPPVVLTVQNSTLPLAKAEAERSTSLLVSWVLVVPLAPVVGAAGPAGAEPPTSTFGSHVAWCAQTSTGFSGQYDPSHHRGLAADHRDGMHC